MSEKVPTAADTEQEKKECMSEPILIESEQRRSMEEKGNLTWNNSRKRPEKEMFESLKKVK